MPENRFSWHDGSAGPGKRCTVGYCIIAACTDIRTGFVVFGTSAFAGSENATASLIGHEQVHTLGASECQAYTWEFNHDTGTGIFQCDASYLADVVKQLNCECNGIGCP